MILQWWISVIHICQCPQNVQQKSEPYCKLLTLDFVTVYQHGFLNCCKCTTLFQNVHNWENCACQSWSVRRGRGGWGEDTELYVISA